MTNNYSHFLVESGFENIHDDVEILTKYFNITKKEYSTLDETMMELIRQSDNSYRKLYHVKKSMLPYVEVKRYIGYDTITFNSDKYKLDMIKKILAGETENEDAMMLIENITFQQTISFILTDTEYLEAIAF